MQRQLLDSTTERMYYLKIWIRQYFICVQNILAIVTPPILSSFLIYKSHG